MKRKKGKESEGEKTKAHAQPQETRAHNPHLDEGRR